MTVEYRDIPGFPGYRVGDDGSVWTCRERVANSTGRIQFALGSSWKPMRPGSSQGHCLIVVLFRNNKRFTRRVHRLVLEAFVGPRTEGTECRHLNGDPFDNHLENLKWGTHLENMQDMELHGTSCLRGEKHGLAKLTDAIVRNIRMATKAGTTQMSIARQLGVDQSTISDVVRRKHWKHIS